MPINVCQNNHITGYKKCPRCGTATERQVAPFHHTLPNLQNIPVKGRPGKKVIRKFRGDNA